MQKLATQDQVDQVAEALVAKGIQPTQKLIREAVGGSFTTIGRMLADWTRRRDAGATAVQVPAELIKRSTELVTELFVACLAIDKEEIEAIRRDAAERIAQADARLSEAQSEIASLEDKNEALEKELAELKIKLRSATDENTTLRISKAETDARATTQDQLIAQLQGEVKSLQGLAQRLSNLESRLARPKTK
jgi:TolA-binding protein